MHHLVVNAVPKEIEHERGRELLYHLCVCWDVQFLEFRRQVRGKEKRGETNETGVSLFIGDNREASEGDHGEGSVDTGESIHEQ